LTKKTLGWSENAHFYVPEPALNTFRKCIENGGNAELSWQNRYDAYVVA